MAAEEEPVGVEAVAASAQESEAGSAAKQPRTTRSSKPRATAKKTTASSAKSSKSTASPARSRAKSSTRTTSVQKARARTKRIAENPVLVSTQHLTKHYGDVVAADAVTLEIREGSFFGIVGPNGAGKTTVLSMISGLNRPTSGEVSIAGEPVWQDTTAAKRLIGVLPDKLRLFDRLTGAQLLYYTGILYGLDDATVRDRTEKLSRAFALESAMNRPVRDYSAGMQKKIALATALVHAPRVLVLDEPFEAIDPVSAASLTEILDKFVESGGSVIMSSHSMDLIQRTCDHVAVIVRGKVIAQGTVDEVRDGKSLSERFSALTQEGERQGAMEWLFRSSSSD